MSNIKNVLRDVDHRTRFETQRKMVKRFTKFFGPNNYWSRTMESSDNIDDYVDLIAKAKKTDAYVARTLTSILQQSLKNGWFFECADPKKADRLEKRFDKLIFDSNMNPRSFIRNVLKSYIDYSNVFIHKNYSSVDKLNSKVADKKISSITLFPSKGWHVSKTRGPAVIEWYFYYQSGVSQQTYSNEDICHLSYNKETHEIFGTPFVMSVLEDVQLLRDLESASIEDYYKQLNKRTVVYVGNNQIPGTSNEINELSEYLNSLSPEDDLVLSGRCKVEVIEPSYNEPELIVGSMKDRVFAGLMASETQMGISGAGRQDADAQSSRETITVEEFQENLEDQLNNTLIRELCLEEFGKYEEGTAVFLRFGKSFNEAERGNNHYMNLYQTGAIDFEELRTKIQMPRTQFKEEESFASKKEIREEKAINLSHKNQMELVKLQSKLAPKPAPGSVGVANHVNPSNPKENNAGKTITSKAKPTNQYGTKNSSKKSVKDEK